MLDQFEIAFGSVVGTDHTKVFKNNQDAYAYKSGENYIVACVADGCGSSKFSEFGAKFGVNFFVNAVSNILQSLSQKEIDSLKQKEYIPFPFFEKIRLDMLSQMRFLANTMGSEFNQTINDFFLFTMVATVITPWGTDIVSIGDGYIALNGEEIDIEIPVSQDPRLQNAPPYVAYNLTGSKLYQKEDESLKFCLVNSVETTLLESILIGSDGLSKFSNLESENIPGKKDLVGPLSQFWTEDKYYSNDDLIRRKFFMMNHPKVKLDSDTKSLKRYYGLLNDDSTVVVIRRKTNESTNK